MAVTVTATYRFVGFSSPVDNPSVFNLALASLLIPIRFRLLDYNNSPVINLVASSISVTVTNLYYPTGGVFSSI